MIILHLAETIVERNGYILVLDFTESQKKAHKGLCGDGNVFLTGEAGSGKSYVIRQFTKALDTKLFPVLASTGSAAVLIGGRTFHSFMGLGIMEGGVDATIQRALEDRRVVKRIQKIHGFILDEVSMISGETLETAEYICRVARENLLLPWGGLKVVVVGDFAQLPPISQSSTRAWAFKNSVWERSKFQSHCLEKNMRTDNVSFLKVLNQVRRGQLEDFVVEYLNSKTQPVDSRSFDGTRLFPRRYKTEEYNLKRLADLEGIEFIFKSDYWGQQKFIDALRKNSPLPDELILKEGCLVMLRQNDPKLRYVNGSLGTLVEIDERQLRIELKNGRTVEIEKASFSLQNAEGHTLASVTNFPVSLAYATTIHKSQGMTLDRVSIDLKSLWEPGQAYVALSRVSNPDQLFIEGWSPSSIKADHEVMRFYDSLSNKLNLKVDSASPSHF